MARFLLHESLFQLSSFMHETAMFRRSILARCAFLVVASTSLNGCFLIAAGAGAGAAVAFTNRGAQAEVPGTVNAMFDRAVTTFADMQINETGRSTEDSGDTRRLEGKKGSTDITVEMKRSTSAITKVEVIAKDGVVDYDKDLAKSILDRIVVR